MEEDAAPMTKLAGKAWVDEQDYEVARVDVETTDAITYGLGLLARLGSGTTLAFERQKLNNELWLPVRVEVRPKARIALLKRIDAHIVSQFSDYKTFTVENALELASRPSASLDSRSAHVRVFSVEDAERPRSTRSRALRRLSARMSRRLNRRH